MEKREALKVLLKHSFFLTEEAKQSILLKLDSFSDEEVDAIGRFLAVEKKKSLETARDIKEAVELVTAED